LCYWPATRDPGEHRVTLTTCTNGRDITWDVALQRGYTLIPKPYIERRPVRVRAPGWAELIGRAWRSRHQHPGLLHALRTERTRVAKQDTRRENKRAAAYLQAAKDAYHAQWENAQRTFRERHL
jgi:hypothetical protein